MAAFLPIVLGACFGFAPASVQGAPAAQAAAPLAPAPPAEAGAEPAEDTWATAVAFYQFDPPDADAYQTGVVRADRGALHLEARYQYEALDSASFFVGRRFSFGGDVAAELVPMIGVVGGDIDGIAPGFSADLTWKDLGWYVESEYLVDLDESDDSFLYTWSELTYAATDWFSFGLVGQRTRLREQELEVDRGLLLEFAHEALSLSVYFFNPDQDDPYLGVSFGAGF
jgi:hypothetical protein